MFARSPARIFSIAVIVLMMAGGAFAQQQPQHGAGHRPRPAEAKHALSF
jgi:hypothetical protein